MKYAMIPINRKITDDNELLIRRVLISYQKKKKKSLYGMPVTYFEGSKLIDTDDYFKQNNSHKYEFTDEGYKLITCDSESKKIYPESLFEFRKYHCSTGVFSAILIKANSDAEAIKMFKERKVQ